MLDRRTRPSAGAQRNAAERWLPGLYVSCHPTTGAIVVRSTIRYEAYRSGRDILLQASRAGVTTLATFPSRSLSLVRRVVARAARGRGIKRGGRASGRAAVTTVVGEYGLVIKHRGARAMIPAAHPVHLHAITAALDAID